MLEELLKDEVRRFQDSTLQHPATARMGVLGNLPTMPHVLTFEANGGTPSKRLVKLKAIASAGLKPLAERTVTFHYEVTRNEGGEFVNYPGQQLRPEDVDVLRAAVDELIEFSKRSQMA